MPRLSNLAVAILHSPAPPSTRAGIKAKSGCDVASKKRNAKHNCIGCEAATETNEMQQYTCDPIPSGGFLNRRFAYVNNKATPPPPNMCSLVLLNLTVLTRNQIRKLFMPPEPALMQVREDTPLVIGEDKPPSDPCLLESPGRSQKEETWKVTGWEASSPFNCYLKSITHPDLRAPPSLFFFLNRCGYLM
jgi:hypothetical protein